MEKFCIKFYIKILYYYFMSDYLNTKNYTDIFIEIKQNVTIKIKNITIKDLTKYNYKNDIDNIKKDYINNNSITKSLNDKIKAQLKILNGKRYNKNLILAALKMYYIDKIECNKIEFLFRISKKTFYNWRKKYSAIKFTKNTTVNELHYVDLSKKNICHSQRNNKEIIEYISKNVINNQYFKIENILNHLKTHFNVTISHSTFYKWLDAMNISYKKATKKVYVDETKLKEQSIALNDNIKKCIKEGKQIISIDEFSIYTEMTPYNGWSYKGYPCQFNVSGIKTKRYSVLAAINKNSIVHYIAKEGSINAIDYKIFIEEISKNRKNICIFMDNARIHRANICTKMYTENKINVLFNIPYMSQFNPIEYFNNKVKTYMKRMKSTTKFDLMNILDEAILTVTRNDYRNFFNKSFENNLQKCINDTNNINLISKSVCIASKR